MHFQSKRLPVMLSVVLLLCACITAGCNAGSSDQTERANILVDEMNAAKEKASAPARQAVAKGEEIEQKDVEKEGEQIQALAREQVEFYKQAAANYREAAEKAEKASGLKIDEWFKNYLELNARQLRKVTEAMDIAREEAEAWVNEDSLDAIADKREQASERAEKVSLELEELSQQVRKIEEEHKNDIRR